MAQKFAVPRPVGDRYEAAHFPSVEPVEGNNPVNTLVNSVRQMRRAWRQSWEHMERRQADGMLNENEKLIRSAEFARKQVEMASQSYNQALNVAGPRLAELRAELDGRLATPSKVGDAQVHAEVRARLKDMPADERPLAVSEAIQNGEFEIARAVLSGPCILSGLAPQSHERLRGEYLAMVAPDAYAEHSRLSEALKAASSSLASLASHNDRLLDWRAVAQLEDGSREPEAAA